MREPIGLVGIERYGGKVTELTAELGKSRGGSVTGIAERRPCERRMRISRPPPRPLIERPVKRLE